MSRLGLGCANLASLDAGAGGRLSVRLVRDAYERGVTFFDTADAYGDGVSERVLGRAFASGHDDVSVATKAGWEFVERSPIEQFTRRALRPASRRIRPMLNRVADGARGPVFSDKDFSVGYLSQSLDGSLRRLGGVPIDVYQLHEPTGVDPAPIVDWAENSIAQGKFRRFGVCLTSDDDPSVWLSHSVVDVIQVPFSLLHRASGADQARMVADHGTDVIVHGVLGEGLLTGGRSEHELRERTPYWRAILELERLASEIGTTVPQLAIWYVRSAAASATCLVGLSSTKHLVSTVEAFESDLPSPDLLERVGALFEPDLV